MTQGYNGFRGAAFLMVFFFHTWSFRFGYLGVQAFFVLSSFLLTPIIVEMASKYDFKDFYLKFLGRRALRIFPLYFTYLILMYLFASYLAKSNFGLVSTHAKIFLDQFFWLITYTYNFFHASDNYINTNIGSHFWSLAVEEQFYLIWPVVLYFVPRAISALLGVFARWILVYHMHPAYSDFFVRRDLFVYVLPFSYFDAFAIGGFFALNRIHVKSTFFGAALVVFFLLGLTSTNDYIHELKTLSFGYPPFMSGFLQDIWGYTAASLVFGYLLCMIRSGKFRNLLSFRPLAYLGVISYGMYVFHFPVRVFVLTLLEETKNSMMSSVVSFLITLAISVISFEFFEKPLLRYKDRWFPK